jgi:hypothetical protein
MPPVIPDFLVDLKKWIRSAEEILSTVDEFKLNSELWQLTIDSSVNNKEANAVCLRWGTQKVQTYHFRQPVSTKRHFGPLEFRFRVRVRVRVRLGITGRYKVTNLCAIPHVTAPKNYGASGPNRLAFLI